MHKKRNIVWGLTLILGALLVIFSQLGYFDTVGIPSLIITILLIPVIILSAASLNFSGILFPLAILGILYDDVLGIQALTPWPILIAALLLSLGLTFLFPRHQRWHHHSDAGEVVDKVINEPDSSDINLVNKFCGSIKYINTQTLRNMTIDSAFGGLKVYFDHADIAESQARIDMELSLSGVERFIPREWKVVDNVNYILGGSDEKGTEADITCKTLVLDGKASFSGITIRHI